ncbi:amino acid adenylation domain-containing protein [Streptomyces sp. NPDC090077]|uniref:amino acid adenylation domain-containing protein n=1 Tax=Streptomyces sp. NPDC090077 TaxID=3365938 RepID=UPI00382BB142
MILSGPRTPRRASPFVHRVFEAHAARRPDAPAVTDATGRYTYGELNARANRFAHALTSRGIGPGSLVGVCLHRSVDLVVAVLGVLKSGAAYVPLDPTYPAERLRLNVAQLPAMAHVVAAEETARLVAHAGGEVLTLDAAMAETHDRAPEGDPRPDLAADAPCYVVFTSGSTGTPKAAAVRHEGWFNLLESLAASYGLGAESSNLAVSSFGFDITQRSLLMPLFTGATLHLLHSRRFDVLLARRLIREFGVRTLHCAPSTLYLLVEENDEAQMVPPLESLRLLFCGGEALSPGRISPWARGPGHRCRLVNLYGVAECSDVSTAHELHDWERYMTDGVPAGLPLANTDVYVLDGDLAPVTQCGTGEICVAGRGVGAGYLNADPESQKRFTHLDTSHGPVELYRTGDLGRIAPDGELLFVGRVDSQVKVRGMRVDLGDVETALRTLPDVADAAAVTTGGGELIAYVVPAPAVRLDGRLVRIALRASIPDHMVPQHIVPVPAFPLSPNGKVDRTALTRLAHN